jgi:hypothetical protein
MAKPTNPQYFAIQYFPKGIYSDEPLVCMSRTRERAWEIFRSIPKPEENELRSVACYEVDFETYHAFFYNRSDWSELLERDIRLLREKRAFREQRPWVAWWEELPYWIRTVIFWAVAAAFFQALLGGAFFP